MTGDRYSGVQVSGSRQVIVLLAFFLLAGHAIALEPAWSAAGGPPVAISADGGFVLSDGESFSLYSSKGVQIWRGFGGSSAMAQAGGLFSPLALTRDGKYSVLGTDGGLLFLDATQRIFWQDSQFHPVQALTLSPDENFVASVADGRVTVYTNGGELVWRNYTYPDIRFAGIGPAGLLTIAGSPGVIHAFNQSGFELWNYTSPGISQVIVSPANSEIIAASDYTVLSLHPSGNLLWKFYTGSEIRDLAISGDGTRIAAGTQGGKVFLLDGDGNLLWSYMAGNWINTVSLSGDGSLVAAGGIDRNVYLFDRSGNLLWSYTTGGQVEGVALSSDGSGLAAGSDRVYYFSLRPIMTPVPSLPAATSPGQTILPVTPPPSTTNPGREAAPLPPPATIPVQATTPGSAPGPLALIAFGFLSILFGMRRVR